MPHVGKKFRRFLAFTCAVSVLTPVGAAAATSPPAIALPHRGDHSATVERLQRRLLALGVPVHGGADGAYGPATAAAVATFQRSRHLPATGAVDAATATAVGLIPPVAQLSVGDQGPAVASLQRQLAGAGIHVRGGADGVFGPATAAAVRRFQAQVTAPVTGELDPYTAARLAGAQGASRRLTVTLRHFPLPPTCMFWDTYGAPRSGGRRHEGTDLFAHLGTPVMAVDDGRITRLRHDRPGSRGGNQFWLTGTDGTTYFYGHLDRFAAGIGVGVPVRAGQVIGYAGSTGLTTVVHLHFEVHPGGGAPVNPYPLLVRSARNFQALTCTNG